MPGIAILNGVGLPWNVLLESEDGAVSLTKTSVLNDRGTLISWAEELKQLLPIDVDGHGSYQEMFFKVAVSRDFYNFSFTV